MKNSEQNPFTIQQYADKIGYEGENPTLQEIQDFAEDNLDWSLWDYPLDELQDLIDDDRTFCYVLVDDEIRLCEC